MTRITLHKWYGVWQVEVFAPSSALKMEYDRSQELRLNSCRKYEKLLSMEWY